MKLEGKRVLITGGTAGIGLALARACCAEGARVMICGRDSARLDQALAGLPDTAHGLVCDTGHAPDLVRLLEETVALLGGLDVLVNNAGIQRQWQPDDIERALSDSAEHHAREVMVNLVGPIQLAYMALPYLREGVEPTVVNVTSVLARKPKRSAPVYCATKAGLRSFTHGLRLQLQPLGVRVTELVPPLVDTAMTESRKAGTIDAGRVAEACVRGLQANEQEILVGKARAAALLDRFFPNMLAGMMAHS